MSNRSKFIFEIFCENDAFCDANSGRKTLKSRANETARLLRKVASLVESNEISGIISDINGNIVGRFRFVKFV